MCLLVCAQVMVHLWKSEGDLWESLVSSHHVGPRDLSDHKAWEQIFFNTEPPHCPWVVFRYFKELPMKIFISSLNKKKCSSSLLFLIYCKTPQYNGSWIEVRYCDHILDHREWISLALFILFTVVFFCG